MKYYILNEIGHVARIDYVTKIKEYWVELAPLSQDDSFLKEEFQVAGFDLESTFETEKQAVQFVHLLKENGMKLEPDTLIEEARNVQ